MEWSFNHACVATLEPFLSKFHEISVNRPVVFFFLSFLETNDGNNLMTRFSENKSNPLFYAGLLPVMLPWQWYFAQ